MNDIAESHHHCSLLCDVETLSPRSLVAALSEEEEEASSCISTTSTTTPKLKSMEEMPDEVLYEIMRFLYPSNWGQLAKTSKVMANAVIPISEQLISTFLPPHLLLSPVLKPVQKEPAPWTLDEFRIPNDSDDSDDRKDKSWMNTYYQIAPQLPLLKWGCNMGVYCRLVMMDVSGAWRVDGSYTNGGRPYNYTMKLRQIGPRRGATKLEILIEGEVTWSDNDIMVIGGKIDGNMVVFHEMMLDHSNNVMGSHLANVVSAVISDDGLFMSGVWLQHDTHLLRIPPADEAPELLIHATHDGDEGHQNVIDHHYPLRVLCSGIFRAVKQPSSDLHHLNHQDNMTTSANVSNSYYRHV